MTTRQSRRGRSGLLSCMQTVVKRMAAGSLLMNAVKKRTLLQLLKLFLLSCSVEIMLLDTTIFADSSLRRQMSKGPSGSQPPMCRRPTALLSPGKRNNAALYDLKAESRKRRRKSESSTFTENPRKRPKMCRSNGFKPKRPKKCPASAGPRRRSQMAGKKYTAAMKTTSSTFPVVKTNDSTTQHHHRPCSAVEKFAAKGEGGELFSDGQIESSNWKSRSYTETVAQSRSSSSSRIGTRSDSSRSSCCSGIGRSSKSSSSSHCPRVSPSNDKSREGNEHHRKGSRGCCCANAMDFPFATNTSVRKKRSGVSTELSALSRPLHSVGGGATLSASGKLDADGGNKAGRAPSTCPYSAYGLSNPAFLNALSSPFQNTKNCAATQTKTAEISAFTMSAALVGAAIGEAMAVKDSHVGHTGVVQVVLSTFLYFPRLNLRQLAKHTRGVLELTAVRLQKSNNLGILANFLPPVPAPEMGESLVPTARAIAVGLMFNSDSIVPPTMVLTGLDHGHTKSLRLAAQVSWLLSKILDKASTTPLSARKGKFRKRLQGMALKKFGFFLTPSEAKELPSDLLADPLIQVRLALSCAFTSRDFRTALRTAAAYNVSKDRAAFLFIVGAFAGLLTGFALKEATPLRKLHVVELLKLSRHASKERRPAPAVATPGRWCYRDQSV